MSNFYIEGRFIWDLDSYGENEIGDIDDVSMEDLEQLTKLEDSTNATFDSNGKPHTTFLSHKYMMQMFDTWGTTLCLSLINSRKHRKFYNDMHDGWEMCYEGPPSLTVPGAYIDPDSTISPPLRSQSPTTPQELDNISNILNSARGPRRSYEPSHNPTHAKNNHTSPQPPQPHYHNGHNNLGNRWLPPPHSK